MKCDGLSFLLADDDEVDVMAIRRAFARAKVEYPLVVACDGLEALNHLRGTGGRKSLDRPYIILLDLNMPRMNGIEFLRALRADPEHGNAVVFVLTSSKDIKQKSEAYRFNVAGYIVKSGSMKDFVELARMLNLFGHLVELP